MRTKYDARRGRTSVTKDFALAALQVAQEWEPLQVGEVADRFMTCLRRQPIFRDMPVADFDLALADPLRELEHDLGERDWRLSEQFKREIDFYDEAPADTVAPDTSADNSDWLDWPAADEMVVEETANGWVGVKDNADFGGQLFETEEKAERWIDGYLEQQAQRRLEQTEFPGDRVIAAGNAPANTPKL
jgi:hypothetical protein